MFNFLFGPFEESIEYLLSHEVILAPILLLVIEEMGIPIPIPGDLVIAYTGYNVSRNLLPFGTAFLAMLSSVLIGSSILFWLSSQWGNLILLKLGKYLHLSPEKLLKLEKSFKKYGILVIIFGRHIPGLRIPVTVFAGMSDVSYKTFILSTLLSSIFWVLFYLDLGIKLGPKISGFLKGSISYWLLPILTVLLLAILFLLKKLLKIKF